MTDYPCGFKNKLDCKFSNKDMSIVLIHMELAHRDEITELMNLAYGVASRDKNIIIRTFDEITIEEADALNLQEGDIDYHKRIVKIRLV